MAGSLYSSREVSCGEKSPHSPKLDAAPRDLGLKKERAKDNYTPWLLLVGIAAIGAFLNFWNLGLDPVSVTDEGRHIQVVKEMIASGRWGEPTFLGGEPYFHKPPFKFWLQAASTRVWGDNLFGHRFIDGLSGTATILMIAALSYHLGGAIALCGSVFMLFSCSPLFHLHGFRDAVQDALLIALVTGNLFIGYQLVSLRKKSPLLYLVFGLLGGLAVLTKSAAGLLPLISVVAYSLVEDRSLLVSMLFWFSCAVYFFIPAAYYIPHCVSSTEACYTLLTYEVWERATLGHGIGTDYLFYFRKLLSGEYGLPAPVLVIVSLWSSWLVIGNRSRPVNFCFFAVASSLFIFSLAQTRMLHYLYPILPIVSLLTGLCFSALLSSRSYGGVLLVGVCLPLLLQASVSTFRSILTPPTLPPEIAALRAAGEKVATGTSAIISKKILLNPAEQAELSFAFDSVVRISPKEFREQGAHALRSANLVVVEPKALRALPHSVLPKSYLYSPLDKRNPSDRLFLSTTTDALPQKPRLVLEKEVLTRASSFGWYRDNLTADSSPLVSLQSAAALLVEGDPLHHERASCLSFVMQPLHQKMSGTLIIDIILNSENLLTAPLKSTGLSRLTAEVSPGLFAVGKNQMVIKQTRYNSTEKNSGFRLHTVELTLKTLGSSC